MIQRPVLTVQVRPPLIKRFKSDSRMESVGGGVVSKLKECHPALKHGAYSATALLPGENPADFRELHQCLIAELAPGGSA
jgi:hypothetical protein